MSLPDDFRGCHMVKCGCLLTQKVLRESRSDDWPFCPACQHPDYAHDSLPLGSVPDKADVKSVKRNAPPAEFAGYYMHGIKSDVTLSRSVTSLDRSQLGGHVRAEDPVGGVPVFAGIVRTITDARSLLYRRLVVKSLADLFPEFPGFSGCYDVDGDVFVTAADANKYTPNAGHAYVFPEDIFGKGSESAVVDRKRVQRPREVVVYAWPMSDSDGKEMPSESRIDALMFTRCKVSTFSQLFAHKYLTESAKRPASWCIDVDGDRSDRIRDNGGHVLKEGHCYLLFWK